MKFGLLGKLVLGCFVFLFVCCLLKEKKEGERSCCPHHQASAALSLLGEQKLPAGFLSLPFVCLFLVFLVFLSGFFFVLEGLAGVRVVTPYFVSFGKKKKKLFLLLGFCRSAFCCEKSVCLVSGGAMRAARFVSWRMNCSLSL